MATYVMSDIHGQLNSFHSMIDKIGLDKEKDTLYLLGDYVDWGPDGVGVIQQIMKMQKDGFSIKCLMGNHEKMMLDVIDNLVLSGEEYQECVDIWYRNMGEDTHIKTGHISFIGDNVTDSRKAATNSYYEICGTDIVLMGVGNDHFVIISRHVNNIDIIEKLKDFSFRLQRTGARREHVMAYAPKCLQDQGYTQSVYLTRAIASIELYGDIRVLNANYDVHHKGDCWDNRQGMILYLNKLRRPDL